jgi:secondary thiamine-phosphate synthase enzyme
MRFTLNTEGHGDIINITSQVAKCLAGAKSASDGIAVVFIAGATAAITTMEYEDGLISDLSAVLEKIAPEGADYKHHRRWGDHNGAAHIKSALIGPSLSVPIEDGELQLGDWQQIVLIDFDERPREREIIVKFIGE